jgi:hypothetical protein
MKEGRIKKLLIIGAALCGLAFPAQAKDFPHDMQAETRVLNEAVIRKLCPIPNARCVARDNPEFYKDTDPEFYNRITKPAPGNAGRKQ